MSEMTRVRLLAIFAGPHGSGQEGDVRTLPAEVAAEFVDGGFAEYVEVEAEPVAEAEAEEAAEEAPTEPAPTAEQPSSESAEAQAEEPTAAAITPEAGV